VQANGEPVNLSQALEFFILPTVLAFIIFTGLFWCISGNFEGSNHEKMDKETEKMFWINRYSLLLNLSMSTIFLWYICSKEITHENSPFNPADIVVIILTAVIVVLAVLTIFLAVISFWGTKNFRGWLPKVQVQQHLHL
jgi:hypothetical protein